MKTTLVIAWTLLVSWVSYNQGWADRKPYIIVKPMFYENVALKLSEGECREICKLRARMEKVKSNQRSKDEQKAK